MKYLYSIALSCFSLLSMGSALSMECSGPEESKTPPSSPSLRDSIFLARLAQYTYKDPKETDDLIAQDPSIGANGLEYIGSVLQGINGQIRVLAFYHKQSRTVLYVVRGTVPTNYANLLADLGIGRLKEDVDLISSLERAQRNLHEHGVVCRQKTDRFIVRPLQDLIINRPTSHRPVVRYLQPILFGISAGAKKGLESLWNSFSNPFGSTEGRLALAGGLTGAGACAALSRTETEKTSEYTERVAAAGAGGYVVTSGLTVLAQGMKECVKVTAQSSAGVNDGFEHLLDHIRLLDRAVKVIDGIIAKKGYPVNNKSWVGHSLGGYLATFGALLTNSTAMTFNAPGLRLIEAANLAYQAGLIKDSIVMLSQENVHERIMHLRNTTCLIGSLGDRDGAIYEYCRHAYQGEDCSQFNDMLGLGEIILLEHGIETLIQTLQAELNRRNNS